MDMQYRVGVLVLVLVVACGSRGDPKATSVKKDAMAGSAAPAPAAPVEKLSGNVVVEQSQALYSTEAAARAHAKDPSVPTSPIALKVIADHGDVIEVTTEETEDCVRAYRAHHYALAVFVPRAALIPRAAAPLTATYPDGTAVAIERGALVNRQPLAWRDTLLAATPVAPAQVALAVPPATESAQMPPPTGEKMICERDHAPELHSKWLARKRKAHRAQPARPSPSRGDKAASFADALTSDFEDSEASERDACGTVEPKPGSKLTFQVGGHVVPWPRDASEQVFITAAGPRSDVYLQCARVRMAADPKSIGEHIGGGADVSAGGRREWEMQAGKVVWPDGSAAGTFTGTMEYFATDVEVRGDLLCVRVEGIAEKVCHHAADAKRS